MIVREVSTSRLENINQRLVMMLCSGGEVDGGGGGGSSGVR